MIVKSDFTLAMLGSTNCLYFFGLEYYIIGGVIETCERAGEKRVVERRKPIPVSEAVAAVVAHPLKKRSRDDFN